MYFFVSEHYINIKYSSIIHILDSVFTWGCHQFCVSITVTGKVCAFLYVGFKHLVWVLCAVKIQMPYMLNCNTICACCNYKHIPLHYTVYFDLKMLYKSFGWEDQGPYLHQVLHEATCPTFESQMFYTVALHIKILRLWLNTRHS